MKEDASHATKARLERRRRQAREWNRRHPDRVNRSRKVYEGRKVLLTPTHRLCRLVMGIERRHYMANFDRVNLCAGKWSEAGVLPPRVVVS